MQATAFKPVTWYVIFCDCTVDFPLKRWLKPGFSHVYAIRESDGGAFWIEANARRACTTVDIHSQLDILHPSELAPKNATIIRVDVRIPKDFQRCKVGFFTCTELVKSLIALKDWRIFTPYQLYKRLL